MLSLEKRFDKAVESGNVRIVEDMLARKDADRFAHINAAVGTAAYYGREEMVRFLLKRGARDKDGWGLARAAERGHIAVVRLLLKQNPTQEAIESAIHFTVARTQPRQSILKLLFAHKAVIDVQLFCTFVLVAASMQAWDNFNWLTRRLFEPDVWQNRTAEEMDAFTGRLAADIKTSVGMDCKKLPPACVERAIATIQRRGFAAFHALRKEQAIRRNFIPLAAAAPKPL